MELFHSFCNFMLHLDQHMASFLGLYGTWAYALLFVIIFCETGLVIMPFLPGDSLLFATGALAANSANTLNIHALFILLTTASVLGNGLNYAIGKFLGPRVFSSTHSVFLNKKYLTTAHHFYETHGAKTIIIARFMPIIRTFAPFIAGIAYMGYRRFFFYNIIGAMLWIGGLLYVSYFFGNLPFIKQHFSTLILVIIGVSLLPAIIELSRHYFIKNTAKISST